MSDKRADLEDLARVVTFFEASEEEEYGVIALVFRERAQCVKDAIDELKMLRTVVSCEPCAECQTQPSDRKCRCAAIQSADPRRHFKGCPERKPLDEAAEAEIVALGLDAASMEASWDRALGVLDASGTETTDLVPCWLVWESAADGGRPYLIAVDTTESMATLHKRSALDRARIEGRTSSVIVEESRLDHLYGETMTRGIDEWRQFIRTNKEPSR